MSRTIVIFSALYSPSMGGVELYTENLAHELARQGYRVVVATNSLDDSPTFESNGRMEVWRLPAHTLAGGRFPIPVRNHEYRSVMRTLRLLHPVGVVIQTRFYPLSLAGLAYAKSMGITPVLIDHGSSYLGFGDKRIDWAVRHYERLVTALGKTAHAHYYGVSQMSADWLKHFGIKAYGTIPNAVDAKALRRGSSHRVFRAECGIGPKTLVAAFTGRLVPDKGTGVLSETARLLEERGTDAQILVAGEGPEFETMQALDHPKLHLLGRLSREDVSALLTCSDVFLFPSSYPEGMPTSLLEASAWGLPSIATDVGGVREIIPSEDYGWVLDNADAELCADRLDWCAQHREHIAEMGARCKKRVEDDFSWEHTAGLVLEACEQAQHA